MTKTEHALEKIEELETLLQDRISDLYGVKGLTQPRHAYIYYRQILWDVKLILKGEK